MAGFGQVEAPDARGKSGFVEAGALAVGAGVLLEEFLHTLHPFVVLDLGKRVFHCVNGIEVSEIHFARHGRAFALVQDMLFDGRTVIDNVFLLWCEILERNIGPDTHGAAHIGHQGPHQRVPRSYRALVYAQVLVRDKGGFVHAHHRADAAAFLAGAAAVEG